MSDTKTVLAQLEELVQSQTVTAAALPRTTVPPRLTTPSRERGTGVSSHWRRA